ncbi:metal ABC transporter substrate-binding protein [Clostridium tagluense]|uniref:metal ABC transporter substrate-binding protein n=1 Tax=Clostridium TaxID=1485 RepID=UPI0013E9518F|nr:MULTISPECIES: metal ABC transporter substrate-binding protein [Clostridium]MBU3129300.1 metal ABC transporter substrate-binding protein [Clostridium tagluense]MBZ9622646.1 metal ABC transporter substrate-binding protein [Clostridium sp. FP2]MCB2312348.1 metal ABC transporter substrate-binding protein [Clostridium tagluense]MCB2317023.1 metal ABC transporter substrate-binding protein [Clostridium tagluense]MCB2321950.1 metal ABC transporter substrate-binding protein [Clostridium tagluense]
MKNIRAKLTSLMIVSVMLFSGCTTQKNNEVSAGAGANNKKTLTVATSFYPMYIFSLNVAKDIPNVKVINMTKPTTGCLHDYSITTDDMKTLDASQVFVTNGADMESFMDKVTKQMPKLKVIDSSKGIKLIKGEGDEGYNPHLWVSISNGITQVKNIGQQLATIDPTNAQKYKENTDAYVVKLEAQRDKMHKSLDNIKNRDIVTFHEAFPYFAKEFNLNIVGVIEREPGSAPSAKELQETVEQVKKLKVKALFAEPQYPLKAVETIAKESGSKVYTLDPGVTGPMDADAYINIMNSNLKILEEALK